MRRLHANDRRRRSPLVAFVFITKPARNSVRRYGDPRFYGEHQLPPPVSPSSVLRERAKYVGNSISDRSAAICVTCQIYEALEDSGLIGAN